MIHLPTEDEATKQQPAESNDCMDEKLISINVTKLIGDDSKPIESKPQDDSQRKESAPSPDKEQTTEPKAASSDSTNKDSKPQQAPNQGKDQFHSKSNFNNPTGQQQQGPSMYPNQHQHKQPFLNQYSNNPRMHLNTMQSNSNRSANIQQNKALNLHKLWPHSLKQSTLTSQPAIPSDKKNPTPSTQEATTEPEPNTSDSRFKREIPENKTPMCFINELVRFNKIKHEYVLLDEIGPAHKKTFFMLLKLGIDTDQEETYKASGSSIKKTQHNAAEIALKYTKFKVPVKRDSKPQTLGDQAEAGAGKNPEMDLIRDLGKAGKRAKGKNSNANPPTVRLNTLAMKLGLVANYTHSVVSFFDTNDMRGISPNIFGNNNNNMHQFRYTNNNNNNPPYTDCLCPDFTNNYTNFMTNEYKPFKYPPVQMYPGSVNPLNPPTSFNPNNNNLRPFLNDRNQQTFNPSSTGAPFYDPRFPLNKQNFFPTNQPKQLIDVKLTFANKEFQGKGLTLQLAKHNAADKALEYFTSPEHFLEAKTLSDSAKNESVKAYRPPQFYQQQSGNEKSDKTESGDGQDGSEKDKNNNESVLRKTPEENRSEVQLIHEYAFFLKKSVEFKIIQESGASHMKKFVTKCVITDKTRAPTETSAHDEPVATASDSNVEIKQEEQQATSTTTPGSESLILETTGEGLSKRLSKKNACINMLAILKEKFEPLLLIATEKANAEKQKPKSIFLKSVKPGTDSSEKTGELVSTAAPDFKVPKKNRKSKAKNIVKLKKTSPEYGKGSINPISRLMQIQQAKKDREPVFEIITEMSEASKCKTKRKQEGFFMQCRIEPSDSASKDTQTLITEGSGSTKKAAKQKAAEEMLLKLGYQLINPILKPSLKTPQNTTTTSAARDSKSESPESKPTSEKKVKFLDVTTISDTDNILNANSTNTEKSEAIKVKQPKPVKPMNEAQKLQLIKQQKLRNIQQAIDAKQLSSTNDNLDAKTFELVYRIAHELLESVSQKPSESKLKFFSQSAETYLKEKGAEVNSESDRESREKLEIEQAQFDILNGGVKVANFKKMLDYLAMTIGFKVNYQSLLGRDGSVNSYVNLSIIPDTGKPLNGNGSTHIESSNSAALCALRYLASRTTTTSERVSPSRNSASSPDSVAKSSSHDGNLTESKSEGTNES